MKKYDIWTILLIIVVVIIIAPHLIKFVFSVISIFIFAAVILFILKRGSNDSRFNKMDRTFTYGEVKATELHNKYDFTFSSVALDCTELTLPLQDENIKINVSFSKCIIKLNSNIPAIINIDSSFSKVSLPNNARITFGSESYYTRAYKRGLPSFQIKINVTFSDVEIVEI